ncbi:MULTISPECIES: flagellar basal body rod C-terminal domain-containing protein [unclassified Hyphomonas]|jgi:flagellar basal-body rod protein FlgC|uniref:flagellar basal body rod C-terminal domain-containing protein n=1 Tax=unclassified Hyphomonas TaxID=2630699 RepID=UPI000C5B3FED|nr:MULTISPECIES: flagellar basal body rod C-terminal domain-containing protein [unclassified Hyphomonas]MAN92307.1 flagellar basal body rod protein FlgC [Hyphomonadaceae bacterium]MAA82251.1 flagellar basal body rod protein FlgC [Hyphomonas sp.]MAL44704.1 flagellar basal body rod protein FlgC [Hyphomonas sp.]MAX84076.1 flagellar basal body rod protein FlgC [Hyphomonas sp.]MDF1807283.1 flagellar basal body rod C-terminal domain-containing protein [Hyphomonas sp.]|tara:strand:+ start:57520 stop:57903 length:384 start_codon:yes stop_codon:yes gene_type:complete
MDSLKATMMQAVSGMQLQSKRIDISSQNVSNADTPGYRRKILSVEQAPTAADAFIATRIELDQTEGERSYDPASPLADAEGYVTASNVSLVTEMADMREANRGYEANLNSFRQARSMYQSLLDILRR